MNDKLTVAEQKLAVAARIRNAISGIKQRIVDRGRLTILDRLLGLAQPNMAYENREIVLCFVRDLHRIRSYSGTHWGVVLHDLGSLLLAYWTLIRTDEFGSLASQLRRVEDYAQFGFQQCDLLGDVEGGFYLFNKAAQNTAVADAQRKDT